MGVFQAKEGEEVSKQKVPKEWEIQGHLVLKEI
jgi:hypothetical protein